MFFLINYLFVSGHELDLEYVQSREELYPSLKINKRNVKTQRTRIIIDNKNASTLKHPSPIETS